MQWYGHKKLDKFLVTTYFPTKKQGTIIECGAFDGLSMSNTKHLEDYQQWNCVHLEPNPTLYKQLVINRPHCINLNLGLSDQNGQMILEQGKRAKNSHLCGNSGILPKFQKPNERNEGQRNGTVKFTVNTITYTTLIHQLNLTHVDLFVLDVEGWEIPVIQGMKHCTVLPDVFCVEACPSSQVNQKYEQVINEAFNATYKKHSSCWLNDVYVKI